jgi:hypothetical protein
MQKTSRNGLNVDRLRSRLPRGKRVTRKRDYVLEALESRTLLTYTFAYNAVTFTASATWTGATETHSLALIPVNGFIDFSVDGATPPSGNWGGQSVPASPNVGVLVHLSTGDGSSLIIGSPTGPASTFNATVKATVHSNTTDTLTIDDSKGTTLASGISSYTVNTDTVLPTLPSVTGPAFSVSETMSSSPFEGGITLMGSPVVGNNYIVDSVQANEPVSLVGGTTGTSTVNVGAGTLDVNSPLAVYSAGGTATLNINDQDDATSPVATLDKNSPPSVAPYDVTGLSVAPIEYGTAVTVLNLTGGTADDAYFVEATQLGTVTNLFNNGFDLVYVSDDGSVLNILGSVFVQNTGVGTATDLVVDASTDPDSHDMTLTGGSPVSTLVGLVPSPAEVSYATATLNSLTISTAPDIYQQLQIDFTTFNPIPIPAFDDVPGLSFNAGADSDDGDGELILYGDNTADPFTDETNNASDPNILDQEFGDSSAPFNGDIQFTDTNSNDTYLEYTGLAPIFDIVPVNNYTFNDFGSPDQSFVALNGGSYTAPGTSDTVGQTIVFQSEPSNAFSDFESTTIANKTGVTFNAPPANPMDPSPGLDGGVNIPAPSDGLQFLQFNTPTTGSNAVYFTAVPEITQSSGYTGGSGDDITYAMGNGVPTDPGMEQYSLYLNGAGGNNTLNYDADGETPTLQAGNFGDILISIPGFGTVDAINYQTINITDAGPAVITPGAPRVINTVEGFQNVDTITGTFTASYPVILDPVPPPIGPENTGPTPQAPAPASPGFPASDFTASINWNVPSTDPDDLDAGIITQDASNPSIYYISGTHTYLEDGNYNIQNLVAFAGGTFSNSTLVPGITINVNINQTPPTPVPAPPAFSTANVTQAPLAVTVFPVVGTEGKAIASAAIATFIDLGGAGGPGQVSDYSATITIINAAGMTVASPVATIAENGNAAQYTITAAAFTLPEPGDYQIEVFVKDIGGAAPLTVEGTSIAYIADAALTPGSPVDLSPHTGVKLSGVEVAAFTDANASATTADFTSIIDWGDGSPTSIGTIAGSGGSFTVDGTHVYAKPGVYATTVIVHDANGSVVTLTGMATVTDQAVSLLSSPNFKTTVGTSTGEFVLFTFTDPDTLATVADVSATLSAHGWGDGTPATAGLNLVVQQIGVTPLNSLTNPGAPIFEVLGSHTYTSTSPLGPPATPFALSIVITTLGGVSTTLIDPAGDGVTVLDAPITSSNGTEITGIEGNITPDTAPSIVGTLLGSFTDANQGATISQFTSGGGSVTVNWGDPDDPSNVQVLLASDLTVNGSPNGVVFTINASHNYTEEGTYAYTVTVVSAFGSTTTISGSAIIADAPLTAAPTQPTISTTESPIYPVPVYGKPIFNGPVAVFSDANPLPPTGSSSIADFTATIDWGDGTAPTAGQIVLELGGSATYEVLGSHTYASTGSTDSYAVQVFIVDVGGAKLTVDNTAAVAAVPYSVTGVLNPASDSGKNNLDDITNVTQPNFYGTSAPFSNITLFETPVGGGTPEPMGTAEAASNGGWSITTNLLPTGVYSITASATDQFGLNPVGPVTITSNLVIDAVPPVITSLSFNRFDATLTVTYQDNLSGMDLASITNSAFYHISATPLSSKVHVPRLILPSQISYTPGVLPSDPVVVTVVFNKGKVFRGGKYEVLINSGTGDTGIQDVAGNALDGNFYGSFPTGDGLAGGNFVADIYTFHNVILPFVPIADGYSPPPKGIDPPAGSGASGKKAHANVEHKAKVAAASSTAKFAAKSAKLKALDAALAELVAEAKAKNAKG